MGRLGALLCGVCLLLLLSSCQQQPKGVGQIIYSDGYLHLCRGDRAEHLNLAGNTLESYPFQCQVMYLAKNGWVWSGGVHAVRVYHDQEWHEVELPIAGNLGTIHEIQAWSETTDGLIWASSAALSTYDPGTGKVTVIVPTLVVPTPTPGPKPEFFDVITLPSVGDVGPAFEAADGALWYNQQFDGIVRWDRTTDQKQLWAADDGFQGYAPIPTKFIQTQDGDIWMGLVHRGVYRWRNGTWQTWVFPNEGSAHHRLQGDFTVTDLLEDRAGHVWVAFSRAGVAVWDGSKWKAVGDFDSPATPRVLFEDSAGTIWIGSQQRGVGKYSNGTLTMFPKLSIVTFAETPDHRLFGGGSDGLFLYDAQSNQWKPYPIGQ
ncbi:hypothetical protein TFLX_00249 [Thermoflexales bacterium]|nr:hypothetical protein TFLX_00249 [Thermoflexales bacterium]